MFQVAAIIVGNSIQAGAVNDDAWRIAAALVRVAHFGPENAAARRCLAGDCGLKRPRKFRRR